MNTEVFPAAMKTAMRYHLRRLCETSHCVDTLVLYLNSPSKTDGTMLLWDVNKNGKVNIYILLSSQIILKLYVKSQTYLKISVLFYCVCFCCFFFLIIIILRRLANVVYIASVLGKAVVGIKKFNTFIKMNYVMKFSIFTEQLHVFEFLKGVSSWVFSSAVCIRG